MRYVLLLLFICNASPNAFAQHVGIKNDVLWDAAMMPNLGVELSMNRHVTVDLWGGGECWDYTNGTQLKLYLFQPELRYWPCQKFEGHFFGIHAHAAHFNVGLISFISELKHTVYRGNLYGGGRLTNIKYYCSVYQWITIKFATTSNREVTATNFYRYIAANG